MYSAAYLLVTFGYQVSAGQKDLEDFAVSVAEGELETTEIVRWFEEHAQER